MTTAFRPVSMRVRRAGRLRRLAAGAAIALLALPARSAQTWDMLVWGNRSSDMNAASSWNDANGDVSTVAPSSNTVLFFTTNVVVQPVLTSSMTVIGLHFHASTNSTSSDVPRVHTADGEGGWNYSGYRITGAPGAVLTLDASSRLLSWQPVSDPDGLLRLLDRTEPEGDPEMRDPEAEYIPRPSPGDSVRRILLLRRDDAERIRGKRILLVDDVISKGGSMLAMEKLVELAGGTVVGKAAVLAEGAAALRTDIRVLANLPLFDGAGNPLPFG